MVIKVGQSEGGIANLTLSSEVKSLFNSILEMVVCRGMTYDGVTVVIKSNFADNSLSDAHLYLGMVYRSSHFLKS